MRLAIPVVVTAFLVFTACREAEAHGEPVRGVGGVGNNTIGGSIGKGVSISLRYDRRAYELFSAQKLLNFRVQLGQDVHQHALEQSLFLGASIGILEDLDVSLQLPFNRFTAFKDNGDEFAVQNNTLSYTGVSQGVGDLLVLGRYRFLNKWDQNLAVIAGIKLPTGDVRQKTDNGEIVGTHNQPGSGSVDFQLGLGYTGHFFDDFLAISADALFRINTEGAGSFRSGNAFQCDLAVGILPHEVFVPFVELNAIFQERDIEDDRVKRNSGVFSLFFSPGFRLGFATGPVSHSLFASFSFPLWQDLPGIQNKERYRAGVGYGLAF